MNATAKMILVGLGAFLAFRALEQTAANFGYDWTSILPRPGSAASTPTANGDAE